MVLGIISDTHDNLPKIREAVRLFNQMSVAMVIHAGDYIAQFSLLPLEGLNCRYAGVFGNNDGDKALLTQKSKGQIKESPLRLEIEGKKVLVVHSLEQLNITSNEPPVDIIIYGHTHKVEVKKEEGTLTINPGECCGWLTGKSTIATVDLKDMSVEILEVC